MFRIRTRLRPGFLLLGFAAQTAFSATPCEALKDLRLPGQAMEIESAREIPAGSMPPNPPGAPPIGPASLPAYCRVDGVIEPRTGRNGKPYAIGFAVALPRDWNGRFYFQGGGGLNGMLLGPYGAEFANDIPALAQGFAVASTDSGHKGSVFDATFTEDQEATVNFLYQAVGKVTVVAKEIVAQHYGRPAQHAYFVGCSTGGREAMILAQRYPAYFDGIVAGNPAMRTSYSNIGLRWAATALNAIAPKNAQDQPQTRLALSDADRKLVGDGLLGACDALDGVKDGLVASPQSCRFDPAVLACRGDKTDACLSAPQVDAVKKIMSGPKASNGRQVYPGYPYDTGITIPTGFLPGILVAPVIPEGPQAGTTIDIDAEAARAYDGRSMAGDTNAWTNLSTFQGRGGKLIFFHGASDPWFSALDTVDYYERLSAEKITAQTRDWSRLFLVPGMGHCRDGSRTPDRFSMIEPIVSWVERGIAPDRIVATGRTMPGESRPLCPYPAHAHYERGDTRDAASYSCRE